MSEHRHARFIEGCDRCDLSRDEAAPTTAAEVLAAHQRGQIALIREADQSLWISCQGCTYQGPIDRPWVAHQADALREAGLLAETTTEWGIKALFDRGTILPKPEDHALDAARRFPKDWVLVHREVTEWTEVTNPYRETTDKEGLPD